MQPVDVSRDLGISKSSVTERTRAVSCSFLTSELRPPEPTHRNGFLKILSLTLFEKMSISSLFPEVADSMVLDASTNQLKLFSF